MDLIEKTAMYYEEWRDKLCLFRYKKMNELIKMKENGEEYEEGAVEKLLIPVIEESKMQKMEGMVFEGEEINKNKLRCYEVYDVINKKYLDRHMIDWDPIFIHKQWELKRRSTVRFMSRIRSSRSGRERCSISRASTMRRST